MEKLCALLRKLRSPLVTRPERQFQDHFAQMPADAPELLAKASLDSLFGQMLLRQETARNTLITLLLEYQRCKMEAAREVGQHPTFFRRLMTQCAYLKLDEEVRRELLKVRLRLWVWVRFPRLYRLVEVWEDMRDARLHTCADCYGTEAARERRS